MQIALLSGEYPPTPGGVGDYTRQLGRALCGCGHTVSAWTIDDGRWTVIDLPGGERRALELTGLTSLAWGWKSWRAVLGALDTFRPDLLHIQYQTGAYAMHPAINFLPWRLRGLPNRPRVVVTAHDLLEPYLFPKAGPLRRYVTARLLRDADAAIVTNEDDYRHARALMPSPPKLIPIGSNIPVEPPPGYVRAEWRARLGVAEGETLVAYFGLMSRTKGIDTLLAVLQRLPHVRLVMIGGEAPAAQDQAYAAEIRAQIVALELGERVTITGQVDEPTVSAHLLAADLAALPFVDGATFRRGSLLAALAHGMPVVTTAATRGQGSGVRGQGSEWRTEQASRMTQHAARSTQHLRNDENVLLVPPNNPEALGVAIRRLVEDVALRKRIGAAGQALAAQFSWQSIGEQHNVLYQALLGTT